MSKGIDWAGAGALGHGYQFIAETLDARIDAIEGLHEPVKRGGYVLCGECSHNTGEPECYTFYPCPTVKLARGEEV